MSYISAVRCARIAQAPKGKMKEKIAEGECPHIFPICYMDERDMGKETGKIKELDNKM